MSQFPQAAATVCGPLSLYSEAQEVKITRDRPCRGRLAGSREGGWVLPFTKPHSLRSLAPPSSTPSPQPPRARAATCKENLPRASVCGIELH